MKTSDLVQVIFVGGPRHGDLEMVEHPHGRRLTFEHGSVATTYEAHSWLPEGADHTACTRATFCPVGMSESEYTGWLRTLPEAFREACT